MGLTYYLSGTPGAIGTSAGTFVKNMGTADSTTTLIMTVATPVTPGGSNTYVQFNDGGVLGGDSGFTFIKATDAVAIAGATTVGGTLGVTGATTLSSTVATGALTVTGAATVSTTLGVTGATTLSSTVATGALTITGAATYTTNLKSTTALATPAALTATQATAFASTVSGSAIMGFGTTNDVSLMNRAGTVVLGIGPNTTTVNMTGLLTVAGFGTHSFSAGGTGGNTFELRNTTAGTGNYTRLNLGNDNDQFSSIWQVYSSTYTSSGFAQASGTLLYANGSGGMSFGAFHASGAIRFYSGGTTQRLSLNNDGSLTFGTSSATVGMIRLPNNEFLKGRNAGNTADLSMIGVDASNKIRIDADGTGSVMSGALSVAGALSKGSGSFLIDHPLAPDTDDLYHGFVEAPRHDLIYRGEVDGSGSYDIDAASRMRPGTFIALTQHPQAFAQHADGAAVQARVVGGQIVLVCQTPGRIGWLVFAERADPFIRTSPSVDSDGRLIPETRKLDGQGRRH